MARIHANGIDIEYEEFGPKTGTPVLLIMGLGAQLTRWPLEFIEILTSRGYRVIRYDNRDVGLSQKFDSAGPADVVKMMTGMVQGKKPSIAYTLEDMANDAVGLLDALRIDRAHIVGASLGGAIGQLVAANHPGKTLSFTSIMSSTGNSALPTAKPEAMAVLLNRPPAGDVGATIEAGVKADKTIGSPGYPTDEKRNTPACCRGFQAIELFGRLFAADGFRAGERRSPRGAQTDQSAYRCHSRRGRSARADRGRPRYGGEYRGSEADRNRRHGARPAGRALF